MQKRYLLAIVSVVVSTIAVAGVALASASFVGQGTVGFDRIKTKGLTVTTASDLGGTIYNSITGKPVHVDDNLRVSGSMWRGGTRGPADSAPFIIDDNLTVTGVLTAGSIPELDDLTDTVIAAGTLEIRLYNYNRCVLNLDQFDTNPSIDDMLFCWDNWVGTDISVPAVNIAPHSAQDLRVSEPDRLRAETDRAALSQ